MENINTLLFSGGGIKCYSLLGSLKYLIENNIIKDSFQGIKDIYYVSGSSTFTFPLLIGFTINATVEIFKNIDYGSMDLTNSMSLDSLFENYGFKDIKEYYYIIETILAKKDLDVSITLKQLYELNNIAVHFKVSNITEDKIEYINYLNNPDIPVKKAIAMTSCIPILFSPVEHNGSLYIDGGMVDGFPYDKISNEHPSIGINIITTGMSFTDKENGSKRKNENKSLSEYLLYLYNIFGCSTYNNKVSKHNHIKILLNESSPGFVFDSYNKKLNNMFQEGFKQTKQFHTEKK